VLKKEEKKINGYYIMSRGKLHFYFVDLKLQLTF
jgi:hypothetical protein